MNKPIQTRHPIGSAFILIGTTIGAGMLALPLISAKAGFVNAALLMIGICILMGISALLVLEVCLSLDLYKNSFSSMARATLGKKGQIIAWICTLVLLFALTAAYIDGSTSLMGNIIAQLFKLHVPNYVNALCFTLFFAFFVTTSTHAVDMLNRGLISIKGLLLILTLALLLPSINISTLHTSFMHMPLLLGSSIAFFTAFGFHTVIPSIVNYQGKRPHMLQTIIIVSISITLLIYLVWLACALGIIPIMGTHSYNAVLEHHGNVSGLINALNTLTHSKWLHFCVNSFANIAMTTSFLGVTLGLFDFLADGFKRKNTRNGRFQTALLTFIPPFIIALAYPAGFVIAIKCAGIFVAILLVIMPALMAYKLRQNKSFNAPYRVLGNNTLLLIVALLGLIFLIIACWQLL